MKTSRNFYTMTLFTICLISLLSFTGIQNKLINWNKYKPALVARAMQKLGCSHIAFDNISGSLLSRTLYINSLSITYADNFRNTYASVNTSNVTIKISVFSLFSKTPHAIEMVFDKPTVIANNYKNLYHIINNLQMEKKAIPNIKIIDGQFTLSNERALYNINGTIAPHKRDAVDIKFLVGNNYYTVNAKSFKKNQTTYSLKGPEWELKYVGDNTDDGMRGEIGISGVNIINAFSEILAYNFGIHIPHYNINDHFTITGTIIYKEKSLNLENFLIKSNTLNATVNTLEQEDGVKKILIQTDTVNLDSVLTNKDETYPIFHAQKTYIMDQLTNVTYNTINTDIMNVEIVAHKAIFHQSEISNIKIIIQNRDGKFTFKEITIGEMPGKAYGKQWCDNMVTAKTPQCFFKIHGDDAKEFINFIGLDIKDYIEHITDGNNTVDITGKLSIIPSLTTISDVTLRVGNIEVSLDANIKKLLHRSIVRGTVTAQHLSFSTLSNIGFAHLKKLDNIQKNNIVIKLNTIPFDFQFDVKSLGMKPTRGSIKFNASYINGLLTIKNVHIFERDRTDARGEMQISAVNLSPTLSGVIDAKRLTADNNKNDIINIQPIVDRLWEFKPVAAMFNGHITGRVENLSYRDNNFRDIDIDIKSQSGSLSIQKLHTKALEGEIDIMGNINVTEHPQITLSTTVKSINCGTLASLFLGTDKIYGYCSAAGVFYINNRENVPWTTIMQSNVQWAISDLRVIGLDLRYISQGIMGVKNESELISLLEMTRTSTGPCHMGNVTGKTTIQTGLAVNSFAVNGNIAAGTGIIQLLLGNQLMNGLIRFELIPSGASFPLLLDVKVKGSLTDIDFIYDIQKLNQQVIR